MSERLWISHSHCEHWSTAAVALLDGAPLLHLHTSEVLGNLLSHFKGSRLTVVCGCGCDLQSTVVVSECWNMLLSAPPIHLHLPPLRPPLIEVEEIGVGGTVGCESAIHIPSPRFSSLNHYPIAWRGTGTGEEPVVDVEPNTHVHVVGPPVCRVNCIYTRVLDDRQGWRWRLL